jgi:hypothetical protein
MSEQAGEQAANLDGNITKTTAPSPHLLAFFALFLGRLLPLPLLLEPLLL